MLRRRVCGKSTARDPRPRPGRSFIFCIQGRDSYVFGSSAMSQGNDYFFARKREKKIWVFFSRVSAKKKFGVFFSRVSAIFFFGVFFQGEVLNNDDRHV